MAQSFLSDGHDINTDWLCINSIRTLSIDAINKANSGHPGLPLGAAPMTYMLWQYFLKHSPQNPKWLNRDRFVLSAGHGSMLLYSLLHLTGYSLSLDEIKNFRQWGSLTPGHPEFDLTPGVEATTGPLGQGSANAVGMAIAERNLAAIFNRPGFELIDHMTYAFVSDGDLMEGVSAEASSLAGHLGLGKLVYLYDSNDITLDGPTSLTFSKEDILKRYESYGWHVQEVKDGDQDLEALSKAIALAKEAKDKPSLISIKTTIGFGSPLAGKSSVHGSPLKGENLEKTRQSFNWDKEPFSIPTQALEHFQKASIIGNQKESDWQSLLKEYSKKYPEQAEQLNLLENKKLPKAWDQNLSEFKSDTAIPTRKASGQMINELAKKIPWLIGGDADLSCSTNTFIKDSESFNGHNHGRNIHYGVREHAMASILNGMCYHSGIRPFAATFFCFSDYMKPAIRLAAMNHLPAIYVWTHDSVWLGEDGPTHQPIEHLAALRAIPNMTVIRPADASETKQAWICALENTHGPTGIILTRQDVNCLDRTHFQSEVGLKKGAYILKEASSGKPDLILIASGSEIDLAIEACELIEKQHQIATRVVSMPSWELFSAQPQDYQESVLPKNVKKRISIEAGATLGWEKWTTSEGLSLGIDRFGASAPYQILREKFGFTPKHVCEMALKLHTSV